MKITIVKNAWDRGVYVTHKDAGRLLIATVEHYPEYKRNPYIISKNNGTRFVTPQGYDCFSGIRVVRDVIRENIAEFYKHPEYLI